MKSFSQVIHSTVNIQILFWSMADLKMDKKQIPDY